jgi:predicted DCC family thiol-disulfide oxidoreductase YuxK
MVYHPDHPERRTVFFDDECELCEDAAVRLQKEIGVSIRGASSDTGQFIDKETLVRELHAMDENGVMHTGIDAVIVILRWHPQGKYVAPIVALPGIKQLGALVYRIVSANRHRWSRKG